MNTKSRDDCWEDIVNARDIFKNKVEELRKSCRNINMIRQISKIVSILIELLVLSTSLYFIISPNQLSSILNIEWGLFIVSILMLISRIPSNLKFNKCIEYNKVLGYFNEIDKIVDETEINILQNNNYDYVFDSYLKIKEICRKYNTREANKTIGNNE